MPYLISVIGVLIGLFALYRFFIKASPRQIRLFFLICILTIFGTILLYFTLTGRILISIGLLVLAIPYVIMYFKGEMRSAKERKKHEEEAKLDEKPEDEEEE